MVSIKAVDGQTFLKNPNIYGNYDNRVDVILNGEILTEGSDAITEKPLTANLNRIGIDPQQASNVALNYDNAFGLTSNQAREQAAYFQYATFSNIRPIAFGRREIVWFEQNPNTDQLYGKSPIETIQDVLQTLKYSMEYNLDYFEDNNVPKGFIQLTGADETQLKAFIERWNDMQIKVNEQ